MNRLLTALELSQVALAAGMDMGFNCVQIEERMNPDLQPKIVAVFGDREKMERHALPQADRAARSYTGEVPCIREQRVIPVDTALLSLSSYAIGQWFTDMLLEIK